MRLEGGGPGEGGQGGASTVATAVPVFFVVFVCWNTSFQCCFFALAAGLDFLIFSSRFCMLTLTYSRYTLSGGVVNEKIIATITRGI